MALRQRVAFIGRHPDDMVRLRSRGRKRTTCPSNPGSLACASFSGVLLLLDPAFYGTSVQGNAVGVAHSACAF